MEQLDIVKLIEKNSITRLSKSYENRLILKVQNTFTEHEQHMFLASFYCYLNYPKSDFVVDLDNIWKWVGFSRKDPAKRVLEKNFIEGTDYKVSIEPLKHVSQLGGACMNKERIMLTVNTFKKFCMKAGTKKADDIHNYYIKLEELLQETINEENDELRDQLEKANNLLNKKRKEKYDQCHSIYIISNPDIDNAYKIGVTNDRNRRLADLGPGAPLHYKIEHSRTVNNGMERSAIESALLSVFSSYREVNDTIGSREREWIRGVSRDTLKSELDTWVDFLKDRINIRSENPDVKTKSPTLTEISNTLFQLSQTLSKISETSEDNYIPSVKPEESLSQPKESTTPVETTVVKKEKVPRPRNKWSEEETKLLLECYSKFGPQWAFILRENPVFSKNGRTNVDLKDKYRNTMIRKK